MCLVYVRVSNGSIYTNLEKAAITDDPLTDVTCRMEHYDCLFLCQDTNSSFSIGHNASFKAEVTSYSNKTLYIIEQSKNDVAQAEPTLST